MIASYGSPVVYENFNHYTIDDAVSDVFDVYKDDENKITFAKDVFGGTYILMKNPAAAARIEVKPPSVNLIVFECEVGYNTSGIQFRFFGRGTSSTATYTFGDLTNGIFTYAGNQTMQFTAGEMYKVTYVIDTEADTHDVYIDGEPKATGISNGPFDNFSNAASAMRLYVRTVEGNTDEDVMLDNIKVYVKQ